MGASFSFGLAGRQAIVTGHRGGIGSAVAEILSRDGAEVIGLDLPDFDLSDTATLEARLGRLVAARGPIDILVNNAGVTVLGTVLETSLAEVERVFRVNFLAAYALMRAVLPGMAERRQGAIVNIASDQALIGKQASAAYGASKAAIAQLSRSAALDWARFGIRVNCIAPGHIATGITTYDLGPVIRVNQPLQRRGTPHDVANAVLFLAGERSAQITGIVVPVDGGTVAGPPLSQLKVLRAGIKAIDAG